MNEEVIRKRLFAMLTGQQDGSWAQVELFRWQYGELPAEDDKRKLDTQLALIKMAQGIMDNNCPRLNIPAVLIYVGHLVRQYEELINKIEKQLDQIDNAKSG